MIDEKSKDLLSFFEAFIELYAINEDFVVEYMSASMIKRFGFGMAQFLNRHLRAGLVPDWIVKKLAKTKDRQAASMEIFADLVKGLKDLCQGIHIITIGAEDQLRLYRDAANVR
jgi:methylenetetrahydrofolate reductase (NADPH)